MPIKRTRGNIEIPRINIVILIVGTRGDAQPFIALGQALLAVGHRVPDDPADLMSFMVKNSGIIPSVSSITTGDLAQYRHILTEIISSTWRACTVEVDETGESLTAQTVIPNPPSFGHIHCAKKLQIPLHIMFTMPWSATSVFPHPLSNLDYSKTSVEKINFLSYISIEMFVSYNGSITYFRQATFIMVDEHVPFTYCWSPSIVPKPIDWPPYINVSGVFLLNHDATADKKRPNDLIKFLDIDDDHRNELLASSIIYIGFGFGSITDNDSDRLFPVVLEELKKTGHRALL
ncbi:unnamed protein product [Rotaria socialis]